MKSFKISKSITNRDDISLNLYLKEISKQPLISQADEIELAKRISNGDKKALDKLVNSNLRFVVSVAKQYQNRGLPLIDLISEGNIGLVKAAEKFDYTKGFRFISYAVWWIRQSILQALSDKSRTIRIPVNQISLLNKINKTISDFVTINDREPSVDELSGIVGIPAKKILALLGTSTKCVSVDTPFNTEDAGTLLDVLPNANSPRADSEVIKESETYSINNALNRLSPREHDVIILLYGIGLKEMPMDEIGKKFGICSERVRQIREKVLKDLRSKYKTKEKLLSV